MLGGKETAGVSGRIERITACLEYSDQCMLTLATHKLTTRHVHCHRHHTLHGALAPLLLNTAVRLPCRLRLQPQALLAPRPR
jgi:hypothetical protein